MQLIGCSHRAADLLRSLFPDMFFDHELALEIYDFLYEDIDETNSLDAYDCTSSTCHSPLESSEDSHSLDADYDQHQINQRLGRCKAKAKITGKALSKRR